MMTLGLFIYDSDILEGKWWYPIYTLYSGYLIGYISISLLLMV